MADDREPSNGQTILSFDEAIPVARKLLFPEDGADTSTGLLTLDRAVLNYADDLAARGALVYNARYPRPHLPASLLAKPVALITETELKSWRNNLAKNNLAPSSVNRICNCLRAALELADKRRSHIWRAATWCCPTPTCGRLSKPPINTIPA